MACGVSGVWVVVDDPHTVVTIECTLQLAQFCPDLDHLSDVGTFCPFFVVYLGEKEFTIHVSDYQTLVDT